MEFRWVWNPMDNLKPLDTSDWNTYTDEEPNSLTLPELVSFLKVLRQMYPQHLAMVVLGLATGLRPSSLRPLRWKGPTPDVLWDTNTLLVRQSHTRHQEVMNMTKQKTRYRLNLPAALMAILKLHVDSLPDGPMKESDL
jgi:integrase